MKPKCCSIATLIWFLFAEIGESTFLVASSTEEKKVVYTRLSTAAESARGRRLDEHVLLDYGLEKPMGIAIDNVRQWLYIADAGASTVVAAQLFEHNFPDGHLTVSEPQPILSGIAAHWVAVDALGTLYISDVDGSLIKALSADAIAARVGGYEGPPVQDVFAATNDDPLNKPQGLAADGFHLFWANGQPGHGSIVRGLAHAASEQGSYQGDVAQLADNVDEAFGVCLSSSRLFYTSRAAKLFSLRTNGGVPTLMTDRLQAPRGCVFDGDGTIFVADAQAGAIYAFSSGSGRIGRHRLVKALKVPGAYGLAVFNSYAMPALNIGGLFWTTLVSSFCFVFAISFPGGP